jgi:hypothetical protein
MFVGDIAALGWEVLKVPISARPDGPARYFMIFLTQTPEGLWTFNEACSRAMEKFRQRCDPQLELPLPGARREDQLVAQIQVNLRDLLVKEDRVIVRERIRELFGTTIGQARTPHLRAAIKHLNAAGEIHSDSKGDLFDKTIESAAGHLRSGEKDLRSRARRLKDTRQLPATATMRGEIEPATTS